MKLQAIVIMIFLTFTNVMVEKPVHTAPLNPN